MGKYSPYLHRILSRTVMLAAMMPTADHSYYEALAIMELVNTRLLYGRLARMRIRYRNNPTVDRPVLDNQALSRLVPEASR